jgi:hypothetical protein
MFIRTFQVYEAVLITPKHTTFEPLKGVSEAFCEQFHEKVTAVNAHVEQGYQPKFIKVA